MSIFSKVRESRQQAKDHKSKIAEQRKNQQNSTPPYRHVPTHAAIDAFASAPPAWREAADRPKIIEQNRRRISSMSAAQNSPLPFMPVMPAVPRVGSSLSQVSYPGSMVSPVGQLPRAYSYSGVSERGMGVIYSIPDMEDSGEHEMSNAKGKEPVRPFDFDIVQIDANHSSRSYSDSMSSLDDLELRSAHNSRPAHRLHPASSKSRRPSGDSPIRQASTNATVPRSPSTRNSRPPPSLRGFSHPSLQMAGSSPSLLLDSSVEASEENDKNGHSRRHNSETSLPGLTPSTSPTPTPAVASTPTTEFALHAAIFSGSELNLSLAAGHKTAVLDDPLAFQASKAKIINCFPEPATSEARGDKKVKKGKLIKKNKQTMVN